MQAADKPIAAIATAPGLSGIAIVRVSGPGALEAARRVFHKKAKGPYESHRLYYGRAMEENTPIDEAMGVYFRAPRSYTGEDVFEVQCHGGGVAARSVLAALLKAGCRLAEPGEFTKRAFLNGRLRLDEAEAVMDLIAASSEAAARSAYARMNGALTRQLGPLEEELLDMAASLEALLEYPDEDVEEKTVRETLGGLEPAIQKLENAIRGARAAEKLRQGVRVVLFGEPNAGKSSLLNALLLRERAIVTELPGTTRDVLREEMSIRGLPVVLSDTAGLREARDRAEEMGVKLSRTELMQADVALLVLDASTESLPGLPPFTCPLLVCMNKSDLKQALDEKEVLKAYKPAALLHTSAVSGEGLEKLKDALYRQAVRLTDGEAAGLAGERQEELAKEALAALTDAREALGQGTLDMAAIAIRQGYASLCAIFGKDADESVIDRIFQKFCLGK